MFDSSITILTLTIFLASLVRTATGFGFALVAIPILSFFLDPVRTVAITMIFQTIGALPIAFIKVTSKEWSYAIKLLLFSLLGLIPGVSLLIFFSPLIIHSLVAFCVLSALLFITKGVIFKSPISLYKWVTIGFIAGFMHGIAGVSGPPILAMLHADETLTKYKKRQILAVFFLVVGAIALIPIFIYTPTILFDSKTLSVLFIAMLAGMYVGQKIFLSLSPRQFRLCTLVLMSISCILAIGHLIKILY